MSILYSWQQPIGEQRTCTCDKCANGNIMCDKYSVSQSKSKIVGYIEECKE